ncbi:Copper resistance protein CopC OS=Tsukamurella paurometabola (strain ATCC 8368 / DSM / CCUG 35730 / CIP 100753 / JCM 10117 / KCTC 9821 / NBRC 16120 / NCIMB 702349 / NCTC 13040) OX=521096 GN=Tpau_3510 PE=4 SV=1 [Tsukamurella paurometabola]|uniref:Copper resistance protein CopC n=1 Tax=Tsukamurella paurometabola (strain ATCC 8368 / DSM 20162 / CCUG 35730 / CIP 100753 / JCM 10117 / KCTC 9821 / NBRC 16120 / NCIMB 702349 / NCTC 13040) TaxID=521096 RepID=D5UX70_TSUPD|nr:copper resistance CopC family protein [Tsukamurella paurometabola]ADG80089.1 copper resistance protein CopC [Tsukamurella paurometabola DSM 20162]SUP38373.1 Copper resistance protein CopC [Tsukamurella paurometabola]
MTSLARGFAALLLIAFEMSLALPSASAHAALVEATPATGSTVAAAPSAVTLRFDEPLQDGAREVVVTGPGAAADVWSSGPGVVSGTTLRADLTGLGAAGEYTIGYRVTSADGHTVSGSTYFTLTADGGAGPAAPADEPDRGAPVLGIAAAVGLAAAAVAAGLRWRRRDRSPS